MKYKIGDRVKVRSDLKSGKKYKGYYFNKEMANLIGEIVTIKCVYWDRYLIQEDENDWIDDYFEKKVYDPVTETVKELSKSFNNISSEIKELTENINKRTMYDDLIQEQIVQKIKEVPLDELKTKLETDVDNYIRTVYGVLPKKIEITNNEVKKEMTGLFHKKFNEILNIVNKGVPLMLTGPAGAGKNHTLEQVAEALNLDFYFTNAVTQEYKLTGFIDAGGVYQETQFYKAYTGGGLFFLDEVDASCPEALIILNSAIANGYFDFPNGRANANENFRIVCAGNTYGTGADMVYVGRNALDGATLDRFVVIEFDYDEDIERQLAYDDELYNFIVALRKAIKDASLRYIVSMRATINSTKLLEIGVPKKDILKSVVIKNMQIDDLNVIIKKIENHSEWKRILEELAKC